MEKVEPLLRTIRRALVARRVLSATFLAALAAGLLAFAASWLQAPVEWWSPALVVLAGPILGVAYALKSMPAKDDLILYLDVRARAGHAIVAAWELSHGEDHPFADRIRGQSEAAIRALSPAEIRPRILTREVWALPAAGALVALAAWVHEPNAPRPPTRDPLVLTEVDELRRIERLPERVEDEEARARLEAIAKRAAALRAELEEGVERREALDRLQQLGESLDAAMRTQSAAEKRALDAATEALADEPELAEALGRRDLEALDRATERAAARREAADRDRARDALEQAAAAAAAQGDDALAGSLLRRRDLLDRRSEQASLARELAEAMPELAEGAVGRQLERLERDGQGEGLTREMVDALKDGWSRLSQEEREKLAQAVKDAHAAEQESAMGEAEAGEQGPLTADDYERMLRAALEDLDNLRSRAAGGGARGIPVPRMARRGGQQGSGQQGSGQQGSGQQGSGQQGSGSGQQGSGSGQQGSGSGQQGGGQQGGGTGGVGGGEGRGPGGGMTEGVEGDGLLARVRPRAGAGAPSRTWLVPINPGEPLGTTDAPAAPVGLPVGGEAGGVDRAAIPQDYQEHVKAYFGGGQ